MHRNSIIQLFDRYPLIAPEDVGQLARIRRFVAENPRCFERALDIGHVTGSAWVVSVDCSQTLLTHHKKLNRWFQLGGHADGNPDILAVALREAQEESGLTKIRLVSPDIFDIDIHPIEATPKEPAHFHYDVRFIFEANPEEPLVISSESKDLAWVSVAEIHNYSNDRSILRMVRKMEHLDKNKLRNL